MEKAAAAEQKQVLEGFHVFVTSVSDLSYADNDCGPCLTTIWKFMIL